MLDHSTSANLSNAISSDEQHHRENAVRAGIASATIEGGSVGPEARAIMHQWAQGLLTSDQALRRIDALHVQPHDQASSATE